MLKKVYSLELSEDQVNYLKARFRCQTDTDLRKILQRIAVSLINRQAEVNIDEEKK